MDFLVHMEVARIEGGDEREKQLREQEGGTEPRVGERGNPPPSLASTGAAGELGYLER
jgi:hypothetical protein